MFMKAGQYPLYFLNVLLIILCLGIMTGDAFSLALSWQAAVLAVCGLIAALLLYRSSAKAFLPFGMIFFLLGSCSMTMGKQLPASPHCPELHGCSLGLKNGEGQAIPVL